MSDTSYLERLSNAELRAKCMELGLPNIPVTDTSRNVIIKRLRTTLTGGVGSPAAKKTTRRETIAAVSERSSPAKALNLATDKTAVDKRRTVAAAEDAVSSKIPERRRSFNVEAAAAKEQRRSVRASPVPKSIIEKSRRTPTMVVLDSDEEGEVVAAAEKAERQVQPNTRRSSSRQPSLTRTTATTTAEYQVLTAVAEESPTKAEMAQIFQQQQQEAQENHLRQQEQIRARQAQREQMLLKQQQEEERASLLNAERVKRQMEEERLRYNPNRQSVNLPLQNMPQPEAAVSNIRNVATTRYSNISSSIYKPKSTLYPKLDTIAAEPAFSRATYGSGFPTSYNEFSDDTDADVPKHAGVESEEENFDTPFLSEFARNLNRLKAEPLAGGDLARRYTRSRTAHEVKGRIAMPRYGHEYGQLTFWQKTVNFNNRYHVVRHLFLVCVIILVVYSLLNFWQ